MNDVNHPELHINEEPSNDFLDTAIGFGAFFAFCCSWALPQQLLRC